ncbi:MAG TPA: site-specific integrase [Candidatus Tectomicrobia bacterium]
MTPLEPQRTNGSESLEAWVAHYFRCAVTTSLASQKVQQRDFALFLRYMQAEEGHTQRMAWTPRLTRDFQRHLQGTRNEQGQRYWSDRSITRVMAHLKTFATWMHSLQPFPLGHPMAKIKLPAIGSSLHIERALTPAERRRLLDAADQWLVTGGRSKDRKRYRTGDRPMRKGYRPYRNRAIIYTLIETGMRRAAITKLTLDHFDPHRRALSVEEKGGYSHTYAISREGWQAIQDYLEHERDKDVTRGPSLVLFLPASTVAHSTGRLAVLTINDIWKAVCVSAHVEGKTPHSARHAMGQHIMAKTGNIAAVQRQLGHRHAAYSMQYARVSDQQLAKVLDDR